MIFALLYPNVYFFGIATLFNLYCIATLVGIMYIAILFDIYCCIVYFCLRRGQQSVDGRGLGVERPDSLSKEDDEFDAYRKRMMLAYRFRPNPLVRNYFL